MQISNTKYLYISFTLHSNISQCIVRMKHFKYIKVFVVVVSMGDVSYYLAALGEGRTNLLSPLALFVDVAYLLFTRDYAFFVKLSRSYLKKMHVHSGKKCRSWISMPI